jgi:hypothetical protein
MPLWTEQPSIICWLLDWTHGSIWLAAATANSLLHLKDCHHWLAAQMHEPYKQVPSSAIHPAGARFALHVFFL